MRHPSVRHKDLACPLMAAAAAAVGRALQMPMPDVRCQIFGMDMQLSPMTHP